MGCSKKLQLPGGSEKSAPLWYTIIEKQKIWDFNNWYCTGMVMSNLNFGI